MNLIKMMADFTHMPEQIVYELDVRLIPFTQMLVWINDTHRKGFPGGGNEMRRKQRREAKGLALTNNRNI